MHGFWKTLSTTALILLSLSICTAEWTKYRSDNQNSGQYSGEATLPTQNLKILWAYPAGGEVTTSPTAADIDSDGRTEIIFGSDDKSLHVLDYMGREEWSYKTDGTIRSTPLIADIDSDGKTEIIFGSDDRIIYALDSDGNALWGIATGGPVIGSPAAADLDPQTGLEIVIGSTDGRVYAIGSKGTVIKTFDINAPTRSSPAIADVDSDNRNEVIIGADDSRIHMFDYEEKTDSAYLTSGKTSAAPAVLGQTIISTSEDGTITALRYTETWVWSGGSEEYMTPELLAAWTQKTGKISSSPAYTEDILAVGSEDGSLLLINASSGSILKKYDAGAPIRSSPAIVKTADGGIGIVFGTSDGTIHILNGEAQNTWSYKCQGPMESAPTLADIDSDGKTELIIASDDRIYVFSSSDTSTQQTTTTEATTTKPETSTTAAATSSSTTTSSTTSTQPEAPSSTTTTSSTTSTSAAPSPSSTTSSTTTTQPPKTDSLGPALNFGMLLAIIVLAAVLFTIFRGQGAAKTQEPPPGGHEKAPQHH